MKYSQWIGVAVAIVVVSACYMPWIVIPSLHNTITGMDAKGTYFGKPGKLHIYFCVITSVLFIIPRIWAKRINWLLCALSVAWAVRNFLLYARCEMGMCPERKYGLYLVLLGTLIMLFCSLSPDLKLKEKKEVDEKA